MMPRKEDRFASAADALKELAGKEFGPIELSSQSVVKSRSLVAAFILLAIVIATAAVLLFWPRGNGGIDGSQQSKLAADDRVKTDSQSMAAPNGSRGQGAMQQDPQRTKRLHVSPDNVGEESVLAPDQSAKSRAALTGKGTLDSGYVQISCTPWAKVFLGDEYIGTTPIAEPVRVKAGAHTITFNNPSFLPIVRSVRVKPDAQTRVEINFLKQVGYLLVVSEPWAEIYVDDQYRETTPLGQPLMVTSGNRKIRLHNPAYTDIDTAVAIGVRDTIKLVRSFTIK
jgi:hypothetical protein